MSAAESQASVFLRDLRQRQLMPFAGDDTSAGMEYEVQVAVLGDGEHVDLPQTLQNSSFFTNTEKRAARGDLPERSLAALQSYIYQNGSEVWENSCRSALSHNVSVSMPGGFLQLTSRPTRAIRPDRSALTGTAFSLPSRAASWSVFRSVIC